MRSLKSGLFAIALTGLLGTAAVVGCSAEGGGATTTEDQAPTEPGSSGSVVPPRGEDEDPPPDAGKTDASKKDSGPKPEAGVDAGPPPPVAGTACPTLNAIAQKTCGACGKSETVCLDEGGTKKWSVYGACQNELAGGCVPGTMVQENCGNCGKVTKTCSQYCAYTSGTCNGQPVSSCAPGTIEYLSAGCPTAQTYRNKACGTACTWGSVSATCEAPNNPNKITISATAAGTVTGNYNLSTAKMGPRISGGCPGASVSTTVDHPYEIVEVKNATAQTAKVSAWLTGTPAVDTVMAAYQTNLPPQNDTERKACKWGVNDYCPSSLPCTTQDEWSGLTGTQQLIIPPGQVVLVWFGSYYPNSSTTETTTGTATLTLRTDVLQ
jgi:hypothetical protein